ncbi:MAG: MMPL family transporter [Acidimicrobiaceae bacterium]|nr:MMPL family transporter [Acidimicrobiaceae bacterium]
MLARIATTCFVHRKRVVLAWLALIIAAFAASAAFSAPWNNQGTLPGTDSQAGLNMVRQHFPAAAGEEDQVVFAKVGTHLAAVDGWLKSLERIPGVTDVGALQQAPHDGILAASFTMANGANDHPATVASTVKDRAGPLRSDGVQVAFSGDSFENASVPSTEFIGVLAALVVLLIVLGSAIAAGLPIVVALVGIAAALPLIAVAARWFATPNFTDQVAAMIGLGVGIDYTLLMVTRFRSALADRRGDVLAATVAAASTAGRSVVLAGTTVAVSLAGLWIMGINTYNGLAVGCMLAVATAVAATLTLLPAMLAFAGARIGRSRRAERPGARRLVRAIERRPAFLASGGLLVLLLLAAPALSLHLGTADAGTDPSGSTTRIAYDLNSKGFGPGINGPILVVTDTSGATPGAVGELRDTLARQPGVATVAPAELSPDRQVALITVVPKTGPADRATAQLVKNLRTNVVAAADQRSGLATHVTGETAANVDFAHQTSERLPWLLGGVLAISFILLLAGFRSVVVALQAVILNLLSVGAAYGILVAVFEWGWGASTIGAATAPIAPWVPPMLFAIVFGLSMDYEVFLLGAIREARAEVRDPSAAVGVGLSRTARVITAAAAIMALVFGSFVTSNELGLKVIGLGLAAAVVVDATVIRLLVVPALLRLLGPAAWWPGTRVARRSAFGHVPGGLDIERDYDLGRHHETARGQRGVRPLAGAELVPVDLPGRGHAEALFAPRVHDDAAEGE